MQPFTVTRFVVDPCDPEPRQFLCEGEAVNAARKAAKRYGSAQVYKVSGEPVTDLWCQPALLADYSEAAA